MIGPIWVRDFLPRIISAPEQVSCVVQVTMPMKTAKNQSTLSGFLKLNADSQRETSLVQQASRVFTHCCLGHGSEQRAEIFVRDVKNDVVTFPRLCYVTLQPIRVLFRSVRTSGLIKGQGKKQ